MRILGICHDVLICSAAIVDDGRIVSAIAEERLDRRKLSRGFPSLAVERCLAEACLTLEDVDEVAIAWNPSIDLETLPGGWLDARRHRGEHLLHVPARLMRHAGAWASHEVTMTSAFEGAPPITFVDHYASHVGNCFFMSPFDEAAVAVLDGRAEKHTSLLGRAQGVKLDSLQEVRYPHSLGLFYGAVTQFLGFRPDSDEWKVMALASYADADNEFLEPMSQLVRVERDGTFELALEHFEFYNQFDRRMFSDRFVRTFGEPRARHEDLLPTHQRIAAAAQRVFEDALTRTLEALHEQTGLDRVVLAGGCFMNSVFNGKLDEVTPFSESFVSSCPDDSGTAVGAAMYLDAMRSGRKASMPPTDNYWGPSYSDEECLTTVRRYGLPNTEVVSDPAATAARDLVDGRIVGWFQGRMEFGQRALGNRSILIDPRRPDGKDVVNAAVKFREAFRPFAPAILAEHVADWFECGADARVPYMERVLRFRSEQAAKVPAVVHVDGTGRLQTVEREGGAERFRALIEEFSSLTGVPIVLNTSFNLNGEPIVCSPDDAIRTFYTCALDVLYLGNVRVAK
jgi:carbamoyltransferase